MGSALLPIHCPRDERAGCVRIWLRTKAEHTRPTAAATGHTGALWSCAMGWPLDYTMSSFKRAKENTWVLAQLARPSGALAGFQMPLAPFVWHTDRISVHRAQLTLP